MAKLKHFFYQIAPWGYQSFEPWYKIENADFNNSNYTTNNHRKKQILNMF